MQTDTWGCGRPGIIPKCVLQDGQCLVSSDVLSPLDNTLWPFTAVLTMALSCLREKAWAVGASSTLAGDSERD